MAKWRDGSFSEAQTIVPEGFQVQKRVRHLGIKVADWISGDHREATKRAEIRLDRSIVVWAPQNNHWVIGSDLCGSIPVFHSAGRDFLLAARMAKLIKLIKEGCFSPSDLHQENVHARFGPPPVASAP